MLLRSHAATRSVLAIGALLLSFCVRANLCTADCLPNAIPRIVGAAELAYQRNDVAVAADYAYVASGTSGLHIFDVSSTTRPFLVTRVRTPGTATGIVVAGDYAYVSYFGLSDFDPLAESGIAVIDVSNPRAADVVARVETPGHAIRSAVAERHLFVADGLGLLVVDVTIPTSPVVVASVNAGYVVDVEVLGDYAYVASLSGLFIVRVTNPSAPEIVGSIQGLVVNGITTRGDRVYLATQFSGLCTVDVSTRSSPVLLSCTPGRATGVLLARDVAMATLSNGIGFVDVSTDAVKFAGALPLGQTNGMAWRDDLLFATTERFGLVIVDVSALPAPAIVGQLPAPSTPRHIYATQHVDVVGSYAYLAQRGGGFQVVDVSSPAFPALLASIETPDLPTRVHIVDDHAYIADWRSGLQIVDVSNPAQPVLVGGVDTPRSAEDVVVVNDHAYIADGLSGFIVVDVSVPSAPRVVANLSTPGISKGVDVVDSHAYVADWGSGLQVIDVSTPSRPVIVGAVDTPYAALSVDVAARYAYVADALSGLQIVDVSEPTAPVIVGALDTPGQAQDVRVSGLYAYVADQMAGVHVVDVSAPTSPALVVSMGTPGDAIGLDLSGEYLYVADHIFGLVVFPRPCGDTPTPVWVSDLQAVATEDRVLLTWRLNTAETHDNRSVQVQRAPRPGGPYTARHAELLRATSTMTFEDRGVKAGTTYWYRTAVLQDAAAWSFSTPILVRIAESTIQRSAIHRARGVRDGLALHYTVATGVLRVELTIYDARGRLVRVLHRGPHPPGEHSRAWNLNAAGFGAPPSGIYFVHLRADGVRDARKAVLTR